MTVSVPDIAEVVAVDRVTVSVARSTAVTKVPVAILVPLTIWLTKTSVASSTTKVVDADPCATAVAVTSLPASLKSRPFIISPDRAEVAS